MSTGPITFTSRDLRDQLSYLREWLDDAQIDEIVTRIMLATPLTSWHRDRTGVRGWEIDFMTDEQIWEVIEGML